MVSRLFYASKTLNFFHLEESKEFSVPREGTGFFVPQVGLCCPKGSFGSFGAAGNFFGTSVERESRNFLSFGAL